MRLSPTGKLVLGTLAAVAAWEIGWWAKRRYERGAVYALALRRARALGRPLVVVGDPYNGVTAGYPCGDITVDLHPSGKCPRSIAADITQRLPLPSDSAVVFVACVLEYVSDEAAAMRELLRVAGSRDNLFIVRVEPWTLTAHLYPGAKRTLPSSELPTPAQLAGAPPFRALPRAGVIG
jgi:hypothetical protein